MANVSTNISYCKYETLKSKPETSALFFECQHNCCLVDVFVNRQSAFICLINGVLTHNKC